MRKSLHKTCFATQSSRYNTSIGQRQMFIGCRSRGNSRVGNSPNYVGANIVSKRFLHSPLIAIITTGRKNSSLGVGHYELRIPLRPIRESLESQKGVQREERWYYVVEHWGNILIITKLPKYSVCRVISIPGTA